MSITGQSYEAATHYVFVSVNHARVHWCAWYSNGGGLGAGAPPNKTLNNSVSRDPPMYMHARKKKERALSPPTARVPTLFEQAAELVDASFLCTSMMAAPSTHVGPLVHTHPRTYLNNHLQKC